MKASQEIVICLFDGEKLIAIARKNGTCKHYKVQEMNFGDLAELYGAHTSERAEKPRSTDASSGDLLIPIYKPIVKV